MVTVFGLWQLAPSEVRGQQATSKPDTREAPWDSPRNASNLPIRDRRTGSRDGPNSGLPRLDSPSSETDGAISDRDRERGAHDPQFSSKQVASPDWNESLLAWGGAGILSLAIVCTTLLLVRLKKWRPGRIKSSVSAPIREGQSEKQTVDLLETTLRRRSRSARSERAAPDVSTEDLPPPPPLPGYRIKARKKSTTEDSQPPRQ